MEKEETDEQSGLERGNEEAQDKNIQCFLCAFYLQQKNSHCLVVDMARQLTISLATISNTSHIKVVPLKVQFLISPEFKLRKNY